MRRIMNWVKKTVSFVNVLISNDLTVSGDTTLAAVINTTLPTSDPAVAGQLWNDAGTVKVSAG